MHNPELQSLARINWQLFCTFTFASERIPERVRVPMFFSMMRDLALNSGVHFKKLIWVLRRERGEQFGRLHFHSVIAGLPLSFVNVGACFFLMHTWEKHGGGIARVREYVSSLDGLDYFMKEENSVLAASRYAADYHELTKFGSSCDVMLSESCVKVLDGRRGYRRDAHPHTTQSAVIRTPESSAAAMAITLHTAVK